MTVDPAAAAAARRPEGVGDGWVRPASPDLAAAHPATRWRIRDQTLALDVPRVMGILNLTPDSFSDGGELSGVEEALRRAEGMVRAGASLLDVGGESTRPGARAVPVAEEIRRVVPVVEALVRRFPTPVSVDTRKAPVARAALAAGASVVNDVSGLAFDPGLAEVVAEAGAGLVLMHMRGTPEDMGARTEYKDVGGEVTAELLGAVARARKGGVADVAMVLDPGIGFAKTAAQSLELLGDLSHLRGTGFPILVGPSRKSFLGEVLGVGPRDRVMGSAVACALAFLQGARIFRVHDVGPTLQALAVVTAVQACDPASGSVLGMPGSPEAEQARRSMSADEVRGAT
ncbi:MAG: dihydropteroate synthase [Gemmatimonadales bacterium]|nr:MAG: dihydropteroate synthase [Gemmatimonadales bacterium]